MVPDIEFEEKITAFLGHLLNDGILVFVEFYIRQGRQRFEGHLVEVLTVVKHTDWNRCRLNNTKYTGVFHLFVEKCGFISQREQLFFNAVVACFAVFGFYFAVFLTDFDIGCYQRIAAVVCLFRVINGPAFAFPGNQHPGAFQPSFHAVEFLLRFGFKQHMPGLQPFGSGGIRRSGKMKVHPVFGQQFAEPGAAVKTYRHRAGLIHLHLHSPFLKL